MNERPRFNIEILDPDGALADRWEIGAETREEAVATAIEWLGDNGWEPVEPNPVDVRDQLRSGASIPFREIGPNDQTHGFVGVPMGHLTNATAEL